MRKLEISNYSKKEIGEIRKYTAINWGKKQSDKYIIKLYNSMTLLQENPLIGVNRKNLSIEIYSFPCVSHIIYYKFDKNTLFIMAVLHKSMLPKEQLLIQ